MHGNSPMQAGTAPIAAIKGYMREPIKLLEQTAKPFAKAQKHPAAKKAAAELSHWRQALAKLIAATYPAKRYHPTDTVAIIVRPMKWPLPRSDWPLAKRATTRTQTSQSVLAG